MVKKELRTPAEIAILTLAAIKDAVESFDRGEVNLFDALDEMLATVDAYRSAVAPGPRREAA